MILVDTPVWSFALRRRHTSLSATERHSTQLLQNLINQGRVQLLGAVRQELLSGLREDSQFRRLRDYLRDFPDTAITTEDYEEAARSNNLCRRDGISASPIDMLLCAVAVRRDWEILTADKDFDHYQTVLRIRLLSGT